MSDISTHAQTRFTKELFINHSSGQAGSWKIEVLENTDGTARIITTVCKVLGGKAVVTPEDVTQGKNIGRANETTPLQQAISEAQSKAQKKMDKGYTETVPEAGQKAVNSLGLTKPMLAEVFKPVTKWPVFAQPKLDGNRCKAKLQDGKVILWSRGGKEIKLPHIAQALEPILVDGLTLDGELYVHGQPLQTITSWIKKQQPESKQIQYRVYDMVSPLCYSERAKALSQLLPKVGPVLPVETYEVHDAEYLDKLHQSFIGVGFEGTMVRTLGVGYEDGKRSKSLQKMKDFQDAEFPIVSVKQGTPKITSEGQLEVAIYECKAPNGEMFTVTAPGDQNQKHQAWVTRDQAIGKQLTVKFFNYTPDGLPFLPVALQIREDL